MIILAKNQNEFLEFFTETASTVPINKNDTEHNLILYPMMEILFLTITAMLGGAENWHAIVNFGVKHAAILKRYLPFKYHIPLIIISRSFSLFDNKHCDLWLRDSINILLKNLYAIKHNTKDPKFLEYIDCGMAAQGLFLKFSNNCQQFNIKYLNYSQIYYDDIIEVRLDNNIENQYKAANNMLLLRQIVIDIIKKHKIKKCSKLGINVVRRLASNNEVMLVDIIDNWISSYNIVIK